MASRRLTKIEKIEILEEFRSGGSVNNLANKYNCSSNTINRTVKNLLTNEAYQLLKEERSRIKKSKMELSRIQIPNQEREGSERIQSSTKYLLNSTKDNLEIKYSDNDKDKICILESEKTLFTPSTKSDDLNLDSNTEIKNYENHFEEIVPLISSIGFETQQQKVECQDLENVNLPETLYMLVDKKVELEPQNISDLPEWSFLPDAELERLAILLFPNQRAAKRSCSRNQKVIKIPNTDVLKISKSYLLLKGITRLIIDDSLISLDNQ